MQVIHTKNSINRDLDCWLEFARMYFRSEVIGFKSCIITVVDRTILNEADKLVDKIFELKGKDQESIERHLQIDGDFIVVRQDYVSDIVHDWIFLNYLGRAICFLDFSIHFHSAIYCLQRGTSALERRCTNS